MLRIFSAASALGIFLDLANAESTIVNPLEKSTRDASPYFRAQA
jgi:hypothetical protein